MYASISSISLLTYISI